MNPNSTSETGSGLVDWIQRLMTNFGAEWVMWLLLGLSVISVAIMLERAWFYHSLKDDTEKTKGEAEDEMVALRQQLEDRSDGADEKFGAEREELLPTFKRILQKHPDAEMKYFARGQLWESREASQASRRPARPAGLSTARRTSSLVGAPTSMVPSPSSPARTAFIQDGDCSQREKVHQNARIRATIRGSG